MFLNRKILFLLLWFTCSAINLCFSQEGKPFIENFPFTSFQSEEYSAGPQILSVIQDNRGIFYFANANGILEYDGIKWNMVDSTKDITFRLFEKDETGRIYCGGNNKMGYLKADLSGKIFFYALPLKDTSDFIVRKIICTKAGVCFLTDDHYYGWNGKEMKKWENWYSHLKMFKVNEDVYAENSENGLFKMMNDSLVSLSEFGEFKGLSVIGAFAENEDKTKSDAVLFITQDKGLFEFNGSNLRKVTNETEKVLKDKNIYVAVKLRDGNIALGTRNYGIIIIDNSQNIVKIIDESSGLYDNHVMSLYEDNYGYLWAGLEKGVSRINYPENLTSFDKSKGVEGLTNCISNIDGQLYIGTSHGINKYVNEKTDYYFKRVTDLNYEVWKIIRFDKDLIVATTNGIYKIRDNNYEPISSTSTYTLYKSKMFPDRIFAGLENGVYSIVYKNGTWVNEGKIEGVNHEVRNIVESDDGRLWVSYEEVSRIDFSHGFSNHPPVEKIEIKKGLDKNPSVYEVSKVNNKILIATDVGLFHYNETLKFLEPDNTLGNRFTIEKHEASVLTPDKNGNIWLTSDFKNGVLKHNTDNSFAFDTIPLMKMPRTQVWSIYPDDNGIVWFGTTDGLFRYDSKVEIPNNKQFNAIIRKVKVNTDSTIFNGAYSDSSGNVTTLQSSLYSYILPNKKNDIIIEYTAAYYESRDKLLFSYMLIGKDKNWSPWTKDTKKEYTGLHEGKYVFKVKAKNIYGVEGKESSFEFTVLPPWFRTWWAYSLWIVLIILVIYIIVNLNSKRLRQAKHRLERIVKERTKEIELEKDKSDKLLLNILPQEVADELKQTGKSVAKSFESVTVLFTDIKGFTIISEKLSPEQLVSEIDFCFREFDRITEKYGIEKIKTIGDSYMCAGGLPVKNNTHAYDVVMAALEIKDFMNQLKEDRIKNNQSYFEIRLGINSGPVVAGIVGDKKFAYDIWGDTVNTASRMESAGEIGKVNISGRTYEFIKDKFKCTYRGKVAAKNKGEIDMYFVDSLNY